MAWVFLVVDDNQAEAARLVQQLHAIERGAEVLTASSGQEALSLLEEKRVVPSLTFVEFAMPEMNAIELLGKIRQQRWLELAPVAISADVARDRDVVSCYRLGACAFLTRPVQLHELRETVRDYARPAERMTSA